VSSGIHDGNLGLFELGMNVYKLPIAEKTTVTRRPPVLANRNKASLFMGFKVWRPVRMYQFLHSSNVAGTILLKTFGCLILSLMVCAGLLVHIRTTEGQESARGPIKLDEFSDLSTDDAMAHLDLFEARLKQDPNLSGVIVGYRYESWPTGSYLRELYGYEHYLVNSRGVEPGRLKTIYGGAKDRSRTELWLLEPGMAAPVISVALTRDLKLPELFDSLSKGPECESEFSIALEEPSDSVRFFVDALQRDPNVTGFVIVQPSRREPSRNRLKLLETVRKTLDGYNLPSERVSVVLGSRRLCSYLEFWLLPTSTVSPGAVLSERQLRNLLFTYAEKHQFTVRRVEFIGNTYTRDRTLRVQMDELNEGNIFTVAALNRCLARLSKVRNINNVTVKDVDIRLNQVEGTIDLTITFTDTSRPPRRR
jgi:hypothetical protein